MNGGNMLRKFLCPALALSAMASPASAAVVVKTYDFTATDFTCFFCSIPPPYKNVSGSFTLSYDDSKTVINQTGVTVNNLSIPFTSPVVYSYFPDEGGLLQIGADGSTSSLSVGDFLFNYKNNPRLPLISSFVYSTSNESGIVRGSATITERTTAAVPEPATWAMLLMGFGAIGVAMRRRRQSVSWTPALK